MMGPAIEVPLPSMQMVAVAVLFFLAGMAVPTYYGIERLHGFGRWAASKLPYKPPAGTDKEVALQRASEAWNNATEEEGEDGKEEKETGES